MTSTTSQGRRTGRRTSVGARVREVFATRGQRSHPNRPHIDHGHEVSRFQQSPLV